MRELGILLRGFGITIKNTRDAGDKGFRAEVLNEPSVTTRCRFAYSTRSHESALPPMVKSSLDHLPERKQRELARVLDILHEEFEGGTADVVPARHGVSYLFKVDTH